MQATRLSLGDVFTRGARIYPDRIAIVDGDRKLTFKEVNERANRLRHWMQEVGLTDGDRIAILSKNNLEYIECFGAAAKAGLIVVPINYRLHSTEIIYILQDSGARLVLIGSEFVPTLSRIQRELPELVHIAVFGPDKHDFLSYDDVIVAGSPAEIEQAAVGEDDLIALIYTAAVGGRARGAMMSHRNFVYQSAQLALAVGATPQDTYLNLLPMYHTMDLSLAMTFFQLGARNIMVDAFDPYAAAVLINEHGVTFIGEFSPMGGQIYDAAIEHNIDLSSVRKILGLDSPETVRAYMRRYPGLVWVGGYGQTETHGLVTVGTVANIDQLDRRPAIPGRPVSLSLVRIVDDDDNDVAGGETGEILVRGPSVTSGYWRLPELTSQVTRNGWLHTGDLGRMDLDGYVWFVDQKPEKNLIKTGGENVYPEEVEFVLRQHPSVLEVCIIGVPDPKWSEAVKAVVVLDDAGKLPTASELVDFCLERIASYKKPKFITFVSSLPKTADGAIDRQAIKSAYGNTATE